jgi:DNA-binding transcriptional LysR family regulator
VLNPVQLHTLRECVRTGSFAEAARHLGYTASAVSQQMFLLERTLGTSLFERSARSVRPTAVAELLASRSTEVLAALNTLEREAKAVVQGEVGTLRLASFATANARVVPVALAALAARRPHAEVHLDEGEPDELLDGVLDGTLDIAVVFEYDLDPRDWPIALTHTRLLDEPFMLAVSAEHWLADHQEIDLGQCREETWICTREDTAGAHALVRLAAEAGFVPRITFRSNDYAVIGALVARGLGVAMLPRLAFDKSDVHTVRLVRRQPYRRVLALHRPNNTNPLLPLALDCLAQGCAEFQANG